MNVKNIIKDVLLKEGCPVYIGSRYCIDRHERLKDNYCENCEYENNCRDYIRILKKIYEEFE